MTASSLIGTMIGGRYQVLEKLGSGGYGVVYKAFDANLNTNVAIKVMLEGKSDGLERFEREWETLLKLRHQNLVGFYDKTVAEGKNCIVMEFVKGEPLASAIGQPWEITRAIRVILQILEGICCIHESNIVHRDIKPHNIMLTTSPAGKEIVKILDFGIVRENSDTRDLTGKSFIGTAKYSAPEHLHGAACLQSDIFSAGVILYEMLNGPLSARLDFNQHPHPLPQSVPSELHQITNKFLEARKQDRYPTAAAALAAIKQFDIAQAEETTQKETRAPAARHPHETLVRELLHLVQGGGNNQICIPAIPGLYIDRVVDELKSTSTKSIAEINLSNIPEDKILSTIAHVLVDNKIWEPLTSPEPSIIKTRLGSARNSLALILHDVDLAAYVDLSKVVISLCGLGLPLIFTSIHPLQTLCDTPLRPSPHGLRDFALSQLGDQWLSYAESLGISSEAAAEFERRNGRIPSLLEAHANGDDVSYTRRAIVRAIHNRIPDQCDALGHVAAGRPDRLTFEQSAQLKWVGILSSDGTAHSDLVAAWMEDKCQTGR